MISPASLRSNEPLYLGSDLLGAVFGFIFAYVFLYLYARNLPAGQRIVPPSWQRAPLGEPLVGVEFVSDLCFVMGLSMILRALLDRSSVLPDGGLALVSTGVGLRLGLFAILSRFRDLIMPS